MAQVLYVLVYMGLLLTYLLPTVPSILTLRDGISLTFQFFPIQCFVVGLYQGPIF